MRVVIADDNLLVRKGIAALLEESGIEVTAQANTAEELLREVAAHEPDVAIVDVRMPPTQTDEGLRAAHEIRERHPATAIVVLSQHVEHGVATRVLAERPERLGYLLKDRVTDPDDFVSTLRRVAGGGTALDPQVVSRLLASDTRRPAEVALPARARGAATGRRGAVEPRGRGAARDHAAIGGEARLERLRQARAAGHGQREPPRARGAPPAARCCSPRC